LRYLTRFEDLKLSSLRLKSFIQLRYLTNLKKLQIDNYGHPHCVTFAERTTLEQTAESKIAKDKQCSTLRKRYSVEPPITDVFKYPVMLATQVDGERMTIGRRGPTRIIYPYGYFDFEEIVYNPRWIWSVETILVK